MLIVVFFFKKILNDKIEKKNIIFFKKSIKKHSNKKIRIEIKSIRKKLKENETSIQF